MTLQRKLLLGFSLMVLPTLFVGVQAIRSNSLERGTLEALRERLAHSRTYAEVEDAMFNQTQVVWRYLSGDPAAKKEFPLTEQVVDFWLDRWAAGLPPDESKLADGVRNIEGDIRAVAGRVFKLYDTGQREAAHLTARRELVERLQPALAQVNREIYRQARELSVQHAFVQVQALVEAQRRVLWAIILFALVAGLGASWLISRSLARPLNELRQAMAVVGAGDLDHAIEPRSRDEIGDLARAFAQMTEQLRQSRAQLVQSEKLASIGQMAAAVAHGLRNPLASLRAAAQLAQRRVDAPAAREQLSAIVEQVDRLGIATRPAGGDGGAGGVGLEITDSGPGIPAEVLPNVCEPFFTTRPEGTGLGLAIAKRYVEEAGGRLEIASAVGRGTTIRIWLPVASGDAAPRTAVRDLA